VFVCVHADGTREYKNTKVASNCNEVNLQGLSMLPKGNTSAPRPALVIGMFEADVKKMWGPPPKAHRKVTKNGTTETWTYAGGKTLTFHNTLLETIEE
jgi:hypothetical protein